MAPSSSRSPRGSGTGTREILPKLARNNLCPLATIPRHECGQRVANLRPETPLCPTPMPLRSSSGSTLLPRTSENTYYQHFALCTVPVRGSGRSPDPRIGGNYTSV